MNTVLGILILVCAIFLVVSVLLQSSKNHRMSGVVSGGAETFFGKQKGKTIDAKLSKATAIISVIFAVLVLVLYIANANAQPEAIDNSGDYLVTDGTTAGGEEAEGAEADGTEAEDTEADGENAEAEGTEAEGEAAAE